MSRRTVIADPFKFAAEGRLLTGQVAVKELGRLADMLADAAGEVTWTVSGELGPSREPRLRLRASGGFNVRCQRCLGALEWPVVLDSLLQLVRPGVEIPEEELEIEEFDVIEAGAELSVTDLLEDELLLAVPIAPRHDACDAPRPLGGVEKESPFAALARLRKDGGAA